MSYEGLWPLNSSLIRQSDCCFDTASQIWEQDQTRLQLVSLIFTASIIALYCTCLMPKKRLPGAFILIGTGLNGLSTFIVNTASHLNYKFVHRELNALTLALHQNYNQTLRHIHLDKIATKSASNIHMALIGSDFIGMFCISMLFFVVILLKADKHKMAAFFLVLGTAYRVLNIDPIKNAFKNRLAQGFYEC